MRHALRTKYWAIGLALVSVAASSACGGSSRGTDTEAVAGADSVGGSGTGAVVGDAGMSAGHSGGVGGSDGVGGSGGLGSGGLGGSGGVGGSASPGGTGGSSIGGAPVRFPLIVGDAACPPAAPMSASCTALGASCVYRGIQAGLSLSNKPFHCTCDGEWFCAESDETGELTCPGIKESPGPSEPCPPNGQTCSFTLLRQSAMAVCSCREDTSGAAGAGGAEAAPVSRWLCGL